MRRVAIALLTAATIAGCAAPGVAPSDQDIEHYCRAHPTSNFWHDYDSCVTWNENQTVR
jgi:hypothetical protein